MTGFPPQMMASAANVVPAAPNLSTAVYDGYKKVVFAGTITPNGVLYNPDGSAFWVSDFFNDPPSLVGWTLPSAYAPSAGSTADGNDLTEAGIRAFKFDPTGTKLIVCRSSPVLEQYSLTTPYVLTSGVTSVGTKNVGTQIESFDITDDGTVAFLNNFSAVYRWDFGTPWAITSLADASDSFSLSNHVGIRISKDGTRFYAVNTPSDQVKEFLMGDTLSPSTASLVNTLAVTAELVTVPIDIDFSPDQTKMILCGHSGSGGAVGSYTMETY